MRKNKKDEYGLLKIVKIPEGEAPPKIREAWFDMVLPYVDQVCASDEKVVLTNNKLSRRFSARVPMKEALKILGTEKPKAEKWWRENGYPKRGKYFCFGDEEYKIKKEAESKTILI
jgi:hypothetical protein